MRGLAKTLVLVSVLSLLAGAALGKAGKQLHCSTTHCSYTEQLKKDGTTSFQGYCDGTNNVTDDNSSMKCHPVKGMTCTASNWTNWVGQKVPYWSCTCTNWSATKKQNATIDVTCPAPSQARE